MSCLISNLYDPTLISSPCSMRVALRCPSTGDRALLLPVQPPLLQWVHQRMR